LDIHHHDELFLKYGQFEPMPFQNLFLQALLFPFFSDQCLRDDYNVDYVIMIINIIEFCVDPFYIYYNIKKTTE
jgi:hypothetical protein